MVDGDPNTHKLLVCVICDALVIGTERVCYLSKEQILKHGHRLGVQRYKENYGVTLDPLLVEQYHVDGFPAGLLLSPRHSKKGNTYLACSCCHSGLSDRNINNDNPPKFAIGNGLAVGSIPDVTEVQNSDGSLVQENITSGDGSDRLTPLLRAEMAPVRPRAYIFGYNGGQHTSRRGNIQLFGADQVRVAHTLNSVRNLGPTSNIYVVLCGSVIPAQNTIVRNKKESDTGF